MSSKLVKIEPIASPGTKDKPPAEVPAPFFALVTTLDAPVDPGWGVGRPPVDPGYGIPEGPGWIGGPHPSHPIYIPDKPPVDPGYGIELPPTIWPPLKPEWPEGPGKPPVEGLPPGYIYVIIPGYGGRWVHVGEKPEGPEGKPPAIAQPKK